MISQVGIRNVSAMDLEPLLKLENKCFSTDRLSRRSLRHWIHADNCAFIVAELDHRVVGYSLVIFFRGTTLQDCTPLPLIRITVASVLPEN